MKKKIHYCWFGGKKLPRDVKKCIRTWKKMLPDYEIKEWNEQNFDINICPFVKEAYENKKWAFVSDYARIYALYTEGGIYFDTDMKIIKEISNIIDKDMFLGYEDSGYVGTAVIGVKEKNNKYLNEILEYYNKIDHFYAENIYNYANPAIITKILEKYNYVTDAKGIKIYDNTVHIYPREYFYPLSYNYEERVFTPNTCMIHLFSATWTSRGERRTVTIYRKFGPKLGKKINNVINKIGDLKAKIINIPKRFWKYIKMKYSIYINRNKRVNKIKKELENKNEKYVIICNPEWKEIKKVVQSISKENILEIRQQYTEKEAEMIANAIIDSGKELVIFNSIADGWEKIMLTLKSIKPQIKIKLLIHGGNALLTESDEWNLFTRMFDLYKKAKIDEFVFVNKSMYEFYKAKGYKTSLFLKNITIKDKEKYIPKEKSNQGLRIGLYNLDERWEKNIYNQLSAISLLENVKLDCIPNTYKISDISRKYSINLCGENQAPSEEEMYIRMAKNDINLCVNFTGDMLLKILESLELGTICITGSSQGYIEGSKLEEYLIVNKEDDIMEIYDKIKRALENKEEILELYRQWKTDYDKQAEKSVEELLKT